MRTVIRVFRAAIIVGSIAIAAHAQVATGGSFVISQSVIAGGGGSASSGGRYSVDGTTGQAATGSTSALPNISLQSGFWVAQPAVSPPTIMVSGKVTTPSGQGLRNVIVTLIDSLGARRTAISSSFGIYIFDNVPPGDTYVMTVTSKRYRFSPKIIQINSSLTNVDFTGLE